VTYRTARKLAETVRKGGSASYGTGVMEQALEELRGSSLWGRGLPLFDADVRALARAILDRPKENR